MRPIQQHSISEIEQGHRDGVGLIQRNQNEPPAIISISDIHGHLNRARSALTTLGDRPEYDPVVVKDNTGELQWAGENYVLVFNGDLIDRGDHNERVLKMVSRLAAQAPPGRVRVTLGNHEAMALSADAGLFSRLPAWYALRADEHDRRALLETIRDGLVVAAYRGYNYTYAHAGANQQYDVEAVNQELLTTADKLLDTLGTIESVATQETVITDHPRVLGVGNGGSLKGKGAGVVWLDLEHISADAPPQVVGHTKAETPQQKGQVVCQNVILKNVRNNNPAGEAVFVETPDELVAVIRTDDGCTRRQRY